MLNRTQNDAIWGLIAPFLTNQIARNTIDFKMNVIKNDISDDIVFMSSCYRPSKGTSM